MDHTLYVIVIGSFFAALSNAAFSTGGAMIMLAITSAVLPVSAIVPIHSTLLIGSTVSRAVVFRSYVDWRIAGPFLVGTVFAVAIAARLYIELPDSAIAIAIAVVMLIAIWLPAISWRPRVRHPWAIVGFIHAFFSTLFAYGALLHAVILHTNLRRRQIVGTMAASLTGMGILKIAGYAAWGFDYRPYVAMIVGALGASILGTWAGRLVIDRVSERTFRFVFKALVTVTAIRLIWVGLANA